jgi:hypothetical protein
MVNNTVVRFVKEKKQDVSGDECLLHLSLKALCFAGLFLYEKNLQHTKEVKALSCIPNHCVYPLLSNIIFTICEIIYDIRIPVGYYRYHYTHCVRFRSLHYHGLHKVELSL